MTDSSQPNLTVVKTPSTNNAPQGGTFTYSIVVSNSGPVASTLPTVITDTVPAGLSITSLTNGANWTCTPTSAVGPATITCTATAAVAAGASNQTVVTLNATKTSLGTVTNSATVTSGDPGCLIATPPGRCTSAPPVTDSSQPNLTVVKTADVARALSGSAVTYSISISNTGSGPSGNTVVTDSVPSGITINSISSGSNWLCSPGSVVGPSSFTCTKATGVTSGASNELVATVNATKTAVSAVTNTVTITAGDSSCNVTPIPSRCTSSAVVNGIPDLFPSFTYSFTAYNVNDSRDIILNISELNGVPTSGVVQFFVPASAGFAYSYDMTRTTSTILGTPYNVQNTDWDITSSTATGTEFTLKPGIVIPAGGTSQVVMTSRAVQPGTKANVTITITSFSGTEVRTNNNSVVLAQSVQR